MVILSKSKYLVGLQCPKHLWILFHEPERIPEVDKSTQYRFDQGKLVGELAKSIYPNGIDIATEDLSGNINQTQDLLKKRKPLFEAAFSTENLYSRADILNPVGKEEWDVIEVKSSTEVKDDHIQDVSFQKYVYEKAGLKIRKCYLLHINNGYIREGKIHAKDLFKAEDITFDVNKTISGIKDRIGLMFQIINSKVCPDIKNGISCEGPKECPLQEICWDFLPEDNIFDLYRAGSKGQELFERGIYSIKDIPDDFNLSDKQQLQRECVKFGKPYIDKKSIESFLKSLNYPIHYLDFETFSTAIPLYDKIRPYQQIPFQFSLHIQESKSSNPSHYYFLASGKADPREDFLTELKKVIGDKGTILVFNQSFEVSRLKELAEIFPKQKVWINNVLIRIYDLLLPFRNFYYYNPKQKGSASIKKVMPAITGKGYEELEINNGGDASLAFLDITFEKIPEEDQTKIRENLEKYCGRDTEGMVWILENLIKLAK